MQMSNEEKKELLNRIRDLVKASCDYQANSDMLKSMDILSTRLLGYSLNENEKYAVLLSHSQHSQDCFNRLLGFLKIDFAHDPFWKEEERKAREKAEAMENMAGRVVCPLY